MKEPLRRYLHQRVELREPDLVFEGLARDEALRRAAALAAGTAPTADEPAPGSASAPPPSAEAPAPERPRAARAGPRTASAPAPEGAPSERKRRRPSGAPALPSDELTRLSQEATAEEIAALPDLDTLRAVAEQCTRCPLHQTRTHVAFGEGDPAAKVVCVGEAPGAVEDEMGRPFVGRAGQLLDRLLLAVGLPRASVYICNVLKSRPPNNRDPLPDEVAACSPYLHRQLEIIDPQLIVAFGAFAARTLLDRKDSLGRMRERVHSFRGYPVVVTYHPAALLRNPNWTRATWEDLQRVRRIVDGLEVPPMPSRGRGQEAPAAPAADAADDATADDATASGEGGPTEIQGGLFG